MRPFCKGFATLSLWFLALRVALTAPADPPSISDDTLEPDFTLIKGDRLNGGCDADARNLRDSYRESCLMARKGSSALDFIIKQAYLTKGRGPNENESKADRDLWYRAYEMFLAMFGKPFDDLDQPTTFSPVRDVQFALSGVIENCNAHKLLPVQKLVIGCTDKSWVWKLPTDEDPLSPGNKIGTTHPKSIPKGGLWYSWAKEIDTNDRYQLHWDEPTGLGVGPMCDPRAKYPIEGGTNAYANLIIFCEPSLNGVHNVASLIPSIKSSPLKQSDSKNRRQVEETTRLDRLAGIFVSLVPMFWLHESMHLLNQYDDQQAVDADGDEIPEEVAYGVTDALNLAKHRPQDAVKNPDNIALFCMAMYLDGFLWHSGYAQTMPDQTADGAIDDVGKSI